MFSSASSGNPFSYTDETRLISHPPTLDENPNYNSSQEEHPPPGPPLLLHFPSPFFDTADPPQDHDISAINTGAASTSNRRPRKRNCSGSATKSSNTNSNPNPNSRRRTGKKDRHSKICTAQGVRDRRMRLSVQIARKFFDLQDLLGFDKASKTIEWLFSKSKGAIKEVTRSLPRVILVKSGRGVHTKAVAEDQEGDAHKEEKGKGIEVSVGVPIEENKKSRRKAAFYDPHHAKESRDKARERARARARTRDKMMIRGLGDWKEDDLEGNPNNSLHHDFPTKIFHGTAGANSSTTLSILGFQTNPAVSDGEDSSNKFMGNCGNWYMENSRLINSDYGGLTNIVPVIGNELQEQNPNPISATSAYFQSPLMSGNQFYCRWQ